ncbi:hypothetical protein [Leptothoe spongobia]|uniref:Uncharacterized protein n=1 Tax=Leptothoe spongobia TAU-MAC 1115 TaxID=1967444 RepID=A0A947GKR1_9CYAN|nr:hypothetical protein [Leptothoe spongobia]MBT9316707.1 hypothetical protein [Leptothoe spongobia TAU-MAC 1115]
MIDIRGATVTAQKYIQSIEDLLGGPLDNIRLEEAEVSDDRNFWLITLGYDKPTDNKDVAAINQIKLGLPDNRGLFGQQLLTREYKVLKVNADSGEVESIKIRQL